MPHPAFPNADAAAQYLLDPPQHITAEQITAALDHLSVHYGVTYPRGGTNIWMAHRDDQDPLGPFSNKLEAQFTALAPLLKNHMGTR